MNEFLKNFLSKIKIKKKDKSWILYSWFKNINEEELLNENFKFDTNIKIVWNKFLYLSDQNPFFINNINKASNSLDYKEIIEKYLSNDLEVFSTFFNLFQN